MKYNCECRLVTCAWAEFDLSEFDSKLAWSIVLINTENSQYFQALSEWSDIL